MGKRHTRAAIARLYMVPGAAKKEMCAAEGLMPLLLDLIR